MPLIKSSSKKAFKHNVETEMKSNPNEHKQDLAIAYSVQRQARKKKMARGGYISPNENQQLHMQSQAMSDAERRRVQLANGGAVEDPSHDMEMLKHKRSTDPLDIESTLGERQSPEEILRSTNPDKHLKPMYAEGGNVDLEQAHMSNPSNSKEEDMYDSMSLAEQIMHKRRMLAQGGQVDDSEADIMSNGSTTERASKFYPDEFQDALKENYDGDMEDVSQPQDSNEDSRELSDEDSHDMVEQIRRKMKAKRQSMLD